jgi:Protein of unknown function (DUF3035)
MKRFLMLMLPLVALSGCGDSSVRDTLGLNRDAPDEFTVVSRPPLSLPPEFSLRPPAPGEAPRGISTEEKARSLLTGKPVAPSDPAKLEQSSVETSVTPVIRSDVLSGGASSLLKKAGAEVADETIRDKLAVDERTPADTSKATTLMEKLSGDDKAEPVVDAKKEAERLRSNKDDGKPITEGEVPTVDTKPRSLIDRIF